MPWKNDQVTEQETEKILQIARSALAYDGDFVELGCYKGDTSLLLAELLKSHNQLLTPEAPKKRLFLYDSFEGLPKKSEKDSSPLSPEFKQGALGTTKRDLKLRFLKANLPVPAIQKAWFSDLTSADLPEKITFAFLDGDFYDSIKQSLILILPHLTDRSEIIIHDYTNPKLPGVKAATDEFLATHSLHHLTLL